MKQLRKTAGIIFSLMLVMALIAGTFGAAPAEAASSITTTYTFDAGSEGWTQIDADGDGHNWFWTGDFTSIYAYYADIGFDPSLESYGETGYAMASASYVNGVGALLPDNYLISPQVELGGSISFYTHPMDENYFAEKIGVFVSTTGNTDPASFTEVESWTLTADDWKQYTVDLSDFSGQGYIAIRHYNTYDEYIFMLDQVTIVEPAVHSHAFTYTGEGATITATCSGDDCDLSDGKVSIATAAPEKTHYGDGKSADATLSGVDAFNEATGLEISTENILYSGRGDTVYEESDVAPTLPGTYTASITVFNDMTESVAANGEIERAVASEATATVDYEILPAELTITADAKEKNVGDPDPVLTYKATGLVEGDTITGELTRAPGEDPGTYDILIGTISAGDNYTIKYVGAKLTIKAKDAPPTEPEEPGDPVPLTGDSSNAAPYIGLMLISALTITALAARKRSRR